MTEPDASADYFNRLVRGIGPTNWAKGRGRPLVIVGSLTGLGAIMLTLQVYFDERSFKARGYGDPMFPWQMVLVLTAPLFVVAIALITAGSVRAAAGDGRQEELEAILRASNGPGHTSA